MARTIVRLGSGDMVYESAANDIIITGSYVGVGIISIEIDIDKLAKFLGPSALHSKNREATVGYGAVVVKSLEAK